MRSIRVQIVLSPGCLGSAISGMIDLFRAANALAAAQQAALEFQWSLYSAEGGIVKTSSGALFETQSLSTSPAAHVVYLTGPAVSGVKELRSYLEHLSQDLRLPNYLGKQARAGALITASCSGVFLLGELGLLDGLKVTTTWWLAKEFARRYPDTFLQESAMVVADQGIVTAGAAMAHLDLSLFLIRKLAGSELAQLSARYTVTDVGRRSQAIYAIAQEVKSHDPLITKATTLLSSPQGLRLSVSELARRLAVTQRTLHRRFRSTIGIAPQAFIAEQRIHYAKGLLESSKLSIEAIAEEVGFADFSAFSRAFRRQTQATPAAYRRAFLVA